MSNEFDFKTLEDRVRKAYEWMLRSSCQESRTEFFSSMRELAHGVLTVSKWVPSECDVEECSYEYSIYIFERVVSGSFKPKGDVESFPWTAYVRQNIKHVVFSLKKDSDKWNDLIRDFQFYLDHESEFLDRTVQPEPSADTRMIKTEFNEKIYNALRLYYSELEIKRLLPLALEILSDSKTNSTKCPKDLEDFCLVLVSIAKRLSSDHNIKSKSETGDLEQVLKSSVRSSIFLSTVANAEFFPKELLLSLDIDSLYRLVKVCGGKTIRVPYQKELDSLLGAVTSVSKIITEGKDLNKSISESKSNLDLHFSSQINLTYFVSKIVNTFMVFNEDPKTKPMIGILIESIKTLEETLDKAVQERQGGYSESSESYKELEDSMNSFLSRLNELKSSEVSIG